MGGPLEGVKVVEISLFQPRPVAGMRLGDLGADVIKIEPREGDPGRGFMRVIGAMVGLEGRNYYFEHCNRNKRSLTLNLKKPESMEIFLKLIDEADVFLNNMSIEAPIRWVSARTSCWSEIPGSFTLKHRDGVAKARTRNQYSFDYTGIARSGLMMSCGEKGAPPTPDSARIGDEAGAFGLRLGSHRSPLREEKTGKGTKSSILPSWAE